MANTKLPGLFNKKDFFGRFQFSEKTKGEVKAKKPSQYLEYHGLAFQYRRLIDNGTCANTAEVARHMGISRAWASIVLNRGL